MKNLLQSRNHLKRKEMKTYYCFIPYTGKLDAQSKIFRVSVGISEREQIKRQLVDLFACDCGFYWRVWDDTTDYEIKCRTAIKPADKAFMSAGFTLVGVTVSVLYRAIIDGTYMSLDNPDYVNRNIFRLNATLSSRFFFQHNQYKKTISRAYSKCKNLSDRYCSESKRVVIKISLIVLLYWIGSLFEVWERTMY